MLPPSHVTYTLAACDLLKKRVPALGHVDYRLIALAAMGPAYRPLTPTRRSFGNHIGDICANKHFPRRITPRIGFADCRIYRLSIVRTEYSEKACL